MSIAEIDAEIERHTDLLQEELSEQIKAIEGQFQKEYERMKGTRTRCDVTIPQACS
mgnify:CR=1 FL=1